MSPGCRLRWSFAIVACVVPWAPMAAAQAGDVRPEAVVAEIPFAPTTGLRHVQIDLAPPGSTPLVMVVATASSYSVITPLAARAAGISIRRDKRDPYRRTTRLGRDVRLWVDERSSDTGARTGLEHGVLGGDFLSPYVVEIDMPGNRVRFIDPEAFSVPEASGSPDEVVVPLALAAHRPSLEVSIDGRPLRVLLDTGFDANLVLSGASARRVGIDPEASAPSVGVLTMWGPVDARLREVASLRVGTLELGPLQAHVTPTGLFNLGGETGDSALGLRALSESLVRIDYPRRRLWLRRVGR